MTVVLINGTRFQAGIGDFWATLADSYSILFFLLAGIVFGYLYPSEHLSDLEWWQIAGCVIQAVLVLALALGSYYSLFVLVSRRVRWLIAPVPVLFVVSIVTMEIVCRPIAHWVWGADWLSDADLTKLIATNYLVFLSFELLYSVFVFPITQRGKALLAGPSDMAGPYVLSEVNVTPLATPAFFQGAQTSDFAEVRNLGLAEHSDPASISDQADETPDIAPAPQSQVAVLTLGSRSVPFDTLLAIQAEEHYIRITTKTKVELVRFRFSDATAQLPETIGMQVHRSHWLSYEAISNWSKLPDGRLLVTLWNRETVKVPRSRRKQFESAFREFRLQRPHSPAPLDLASRAL